MRENYWVNAFTNAEVHVNCPAGSPRAWVLKSMGAPSGELYIQPGSMYPKSVGIAGLWIRDGARLPDLGNNRTLYRFFDLPENLSRPHHQKRNKKQAYIGVCACIPAHEIMMWMRAFKESGCKWLWWSMPEPEPEREVKVKKRISLDHIALYKEFETGGHIINSCKLIDRVSKAFKLCKEEYVMWFEDDVSINKPIADIFKYDINGYNPNNVQSFSLPELKKKYNFIDMNKRYSITGHGGSVYHKTNTLKAFENKEIINDGSGTPIYMPPELNNPHRVIGDQTYWMVSDKSDIYSLGMLFFYCGLLTDNEDLDSESKFFDLIGRKYNVENGKILNFLVNLI